MQGRPHARCGARGGQRNNAGQPVLCRLSGHLSDSGRRSALRGRSDLFHMPCREGEFDVAYSICVLHHTPDPRAAFERVAAVVKKEGGLAVYLYAGYGPRLPHAANDLVRSMTTRLPLPLMFWLSSLSVPAHYVYRLPI